MVPASAAASVAERVRFTAAERGEIIFCRPGRPAVSVTSVQKMLAEQ